MLAAALTWLGPKSGPPLVAVAPTSADKPDPALHDMLLSPKVCDGVSCSRLVCLIASSMSIVAADRVATARYPPYSSRPAAQSASLTPLAPAPRPGTGSTVGEGYDADLVNLPERNTAAAGAQAAKPSTDLPSGSGALLTATLPYASRTLQNGHSVEPYHRDDYHDDAGGSGGFRDSTRIPDRLGIRHHSSTAKGDHHRSAAAARGVRGGGRRAPPNRRTSRRRRKHRQLAWWERPRFLVVALALIVAIGLGVGLGVGLSQAHKNRNKDQNQKNSSDGGAANASNGIAPPLRPSQSGESGVVAVSVSVKAIGPTVTTESFVPTASTTRPAPGVPFTVDLSPLL
ncbi:hypothetical protein JCM3774_003704 [Rhodotorula dairenensis]